MATTRISAQLPPNIDVTKSPLAYGDRALPRLNRELKDGELIVRQKALRTLCDYLHDPEHIAEALRV
ncbi:radial spoke head 14 homolog, partial [Saccoglossus kowalevskii]